MKRIIYAIFYKCWRIYDYFSPDMCPQGGHRIKSALVTNVCGTTYCLHRDCLRANIEEVERKTDVKVDKTYLDL